MYKMEANACPHGLWLLFQEEELGRNLCLPLSWQEWGDTMGKTCLLLSLRDERKLANIAKDPLQTL